MTVRLSVLDVSGVSILNLNANHGDDYAACWVEDVVRDLHALGLAGLTVVEYDTDVGGDEWVHVIRSPGAIRADMHRRPDGRLEVVSLVKDHADTVGGLSAPGTPAARAIGRASERITRAVRVLHSDLDLAHTPGTVRGKHVPTATRAQRWRDQNFPAHARIARKLRAAR